MVRNPIESRGSVWSLAVILALFFAAIIGAGYSYYRIQQEEFLGSTREHLTAIANLKVGQIVDWRERWINDGRLIMANPFLMSHLHGFLNNTNDLESREDLVRWMEVRQKYMGYERVLLVDAQRRVVLAAPESKNWLGPTAQTLLTEALNTNDMIMSDLHRSQVSGGIKLDILAPLLVTRGSNMDASAEGRPLAFLLMEANPEDHLFPMIRTWPTSSRTAETLLVRREGSHVLYLNELRHRTNTALKLLLPADAATHLPAALAVRGITGVVEGLDYRGVPVVAAIEAIPGSPWFIVAKVDQEEIYAPLRQHSRLIFVLGVIAMLAASLGILFLWRQRDAQWLQKQLAFERERKAIADRIVSLNQQANDVILLLDDQWKIIEANDMAVKTFGCSREELMRLSLHDLRMPGSKVDLEGVMQRTETQSGLRGESMLRRKDGTTFPVEYSACLLEIDGKKFCQSIIRDITQQKAREHEIERLNSVYAALSQVNQVITRVKSRQELFEAVCRVIIEYGGFKMAWVGWHDPITQQVIPLAAHGDESGYLARIKVYADDRLEGMGPTGSAIREGRPDVCNELPVGSRMLPWRGEIVRAGYCSSAAFPLRLNNKVRGALTVYSTESGFFGVKEIALLEEAAMDISYALDQFERDEQGRRAEVALNESEQRFSVFMDYLPAAVFIKDAQGRLVFANRYIQDLFGWHDPVGKLTTELLPPEIAEKMILDDQAVLNTGFRRVVERVVTAEGKERYFDTHKFPIVVEGRAALLGGIAIDITQRTQVETEARRQREFVNTLLDNLADGVVACDADGALVLFNQAARQWLGVNFMNVPPDQWAERFGLYEPDGKTFLSPDAMPLMRALNGETVIDREITILAKGQPPRLALASASAFYDSGKHKLGAVAVMRDVTARRRDLAALRQKTEELDRFFNLAIDLWCVADMQGNFHRLNPAWETTLGYAKEDLLAHPFLDLVHPDDLAATREAISDLADQREITNFINRYRCKDGTFRWLEWRSVPADKLIYASARDITERKQSEEMLRASLDEKTTLLKEIHHRVKNNLQIVTSLLNLQAAQITNPEVLSILSETRNRVRSMGLLHETLYRSDNLARINFVGYIESLCNHLVRSYGAMSARIQIVRRIDPVCLGIDQAVPSGLLINELISNALKHAFPGERQGQIEIDLHIEAGRVLLTVADNGIGLPANLEIKRASTLGLQLVNMLTTQLRGTVEMRQNGGTAFHIAFPSDGSEITSQPPTV